MPVLVSLLLITISFQVALAQDWTRHVPAPGDEIPFKRLSTWDKVKLGASFYTNPTKIQDTGFVYTYDVEAGAMKTHLYELEKDGTIYCAAVGADVVRLIPCTTVRKKAEDKGDPEQFKAVSDKPNVLGQKPQDVLIKKD